MTILIAMWRLVVALVTTIVCGWRPALGSLYEKLCAICRRWRERTQRRGRDKKSADAPCVPINEKAFKRPDPLLYSQQDLMARGYAVTWDNPDIQLFRGGVAVPSSTLDPDTDYEVVARVWNNSTDAPVIGLPVVFSYMSFGVGAKKHAIGATSIPELGVKGGPNHPAFAKMLWHTPAAPGHYCIQVLLDPTDDRNFNNNLGQENTTVAALHSPAETTLTLRNDTPREQTIRFEVDAYQIPPLSPCDPARPPAPSPAVRIFRDQIVVPPVHDRRNYPLPEGWTVAFDPAEPVLAPDMEISVVARVTPPAGFHGRQAINVHAFDRYTLVGGITLYAETA